MLTTRQSFNERLKVWAAYDCCYVLLLFPQIIRDYDRNHFLMKTSIPHFPRITCFLVVFSI